MSDFAPAATRTPSPRGRIRRAWKSAHEAVDGVPRWARIAALAIPFVVLPSGVWRIATIPLADEPAGGSGASGDLPQWFPADLYPVVLSLVTEGIAFLAIGLIARWGEVFPRWIPGLRGRRVPIVAVVVPAAIGSAILTVLWTWSLAATLTGRTIQGDPIPTDNPFAQYDWEFVFVAVAYVPLIAWGPLLAAVTVAYYVRRRS